MIDADDYEYESWSGSALRYAELAAHQIARFRNPWWNPTWHDLIPHDPPTLRPFAVAWGLRGKRSRTGPAKRDVEAAACSPATPLDFGSGCGSGFGSGASTSGGEEGVSPLETDAAAAAAATVGRKRRRKMGDDADVSVAGGGCETVQAVRKGSSPSDFKISATAKDMRRAGKKKTLGELQEEEKVLLQEKNMLQKEVEMRRKAYEALKAENERLKAQQSQETTIDAVVNRAQFLLPDLNEPLSDNLD